MMEITVVIPTRNEEDNLEKLLRRLNQTLKINNIPYQCLIIDDHSTDKTAKIVERLAKEFPIIFESKQGKQGKAFSILQALKKVKTKLTCVIDADLQYPPESIPLMIAEIKKGADLVVAERTTSHPKALRYLLSQLYRSLFARLLHRVPFDVFSGLKVFRTELGKRLPIESEAWSFDLEFLLRARQANYLIASVQVPFFGRVRNKARRSNNNWLTAGWQMVKSALYHKVSQPVVIPFDDELKAQYGKGFDFNGKRFITHTDLHPRQSALYRLNQKHAFTLLVVLMAIGVSLMIDWYVTLIWLVAILTVLYFLDLLFNLYLIVRSFLKTPEIKIPQAELAQIPDSAWPSYSIFCPLYKEHEVIPQFVDAISQLDYPKEKLQVLLLLEADDKVTIAKAREFDLPEYFEIVVVPDSLPKTKPKACNYGLTKATGEYVVIYDAEDVPDPKQLKKAVLAFKQAGPKVICIQAKLNFYNPHQNLLTRLFTSEYSLWFDLVLTGMQSVEAPIPLGGTSNHFRVADLFRLRGWDAFNVTEDCDLGMRLVKQGYRTAILDSTTLEEANSDFKNWFWQRSRWIKGYIQSYFVHLRDFKQFMYDWHQPHGITFQLIVGGKVLSMLINPIMWVIVIIYFAFRPVVGGFIDSLFPAPIFYMAIFSLIFGNALYLYYYMVGSAKRGHDELVKFGFLVPFYWLAMSAAAYMAIYKLITAPHHWSKTKHGLHLTNRKGLAQAQERIGLHSFSGVPISGGHLTSLAK